MTNPDTRAVATQVPYDDIRRALAHARETAYGTLEGLALHPDQIEALLADAQRWRMVREGGEEVVEAIVDVLTDAGLNNANEMDARAVLRTLEGLVK